MDDDKIRSYSPYSSDSCTAIYIKSTSPKKKACFKQKVCLQSGDVNKCFLLACKLVVFYKILQYLMMVLTTEVASKKESFNSYFTFTVIYCGSSLSQSEGEVQELASSGLLESPSVNKQGKTRIPY